MDVTRNAQMSRSGPQERRQLGAGRLESLPKPLRIDSDVRSGQRWAPSSQRDKNAAQRRFVAAESPPERLDVRLDEVLESAFDVERGGDVPGAELEESDRCSRRDEPEEAVDRASPVPVRAGELDAGRQHAQRLIAAQPVERLLVDNVDGDREHGLVLGREGGYGAGLGGRAAREQNDVDIVLGGTGDESFVGLQRGSRQSLEVVNRQADQVRLDLESSLEIGRTRGVAGAALQVDADGGFAEAVDGVGDPCSLGDDPADGSGRARHTLRLPEGAQGQLAKRRGLYPDAFAGMRLAGHDQKSRSLISRRARSSAIFQGVILSVAVA